MRRVEFWLVRRRDATGREVWRVFLWCVAHGRPWRSCCGSTWDTIPPARPAEAWDARAFRLTTRRALE